MTNLTFVGQSTVELRYEVNDDVEDPDSQWYSSSMNFNIIGVR